MRCTESAGGLKRSCRLSLALAGVLVIAALLNASSPAFALSQQGHVFELAFAKKGGAEGELSKPSGVAVNEQTGDVYVADSANNRVEVFGPKGEFIEVWGWGVKDGKERFETCKPGEGLEGVCHPGIAGTGEGQLNAPTAIAVDNSTSEQDKSRGDVYVVSEAAFETNTVEKFGSEDGSEVRSLGRLTTPVVELGGVAVDGNGGVWVYVDAPLGGESRRAEGFDDAQPNAHVATVVFEGGEEGEFCGIPGFAVDAAAHAFYADHEQELFDACPGELEPPFLPKVPSPAITAKLERVAGKEPPVAEPVIADLESENSTAVAVDESSDRQTSGDVYVDNSSSIAAFDSNGSFIQRFGAAGELKKSAGVAVDAATGEVYVTDAGDNRVNVFSLEEEPAQPEVNSISSQNVNPTTTQLTAEIDPNGAAIEYFFEYGTVECPAPSCQRLPQPVGRIEAGFGDQKVEVTAGELQPGTTYFYRVVAKNAKGAAHGEQELHTFTTLPNPVGLLADGRAWEIVSPAEKDGASVEPLGWGSQSPLGGVIESSEEGNAITYAADGPLEAEPEANRAPEGVQAISSRTPQGWSTRDIITSYEHGDGLISGSPQEYRVFSPDLSLALVAPPAGGRFQEPPLASQEPGVKEERGLYRRHNSTCPASPATCYEPLVAAKDDETNEPFGGRLEYDGATSDLKHVIIGSEARLSKAAPSEQEGLYEWTAGEPAKLQYVSLLPPNEETGAVSPALAPELGGDTGGKENDRHAVSADGSRVFWSGTKLEGKEEAEVRGLYMRDTDKEMTLQVNAYQIEVPRVIHRLELADPEVNDPEFQLASANGSRIFFTDTVSLTSDAELRPIGTNSPADLYVCEIEEDAQGLACKLKDLTVDPRSGLGESAQVIGTMLGASEDGSTIYFVANGVLAAGAKPGACRGPGRAKTPPEGATCNLYVDHYNGKEWEKPKLVAILSAEDFPDWGEGAGAPGLAGLTARVSSDGRYLAFMSQRPLTGYDNEDITSEHPGERLDEEVFLYDATEERLTCASCNSSPGVRPAGVFDTEESGEGAGLLVDPHTPVWNQRWLAGSIPTWTPTSPDLSPYQSRYLLNDGRLFFNGADALVPQAVKHRREIVNGREYQVGVENVYEYEPEGIGSCQQAGGCVSLISSGSSEHESAFLDASSSGSNVFFLTSQQLVPDDRDSSLDVYDARECTEVSPCIASEPPPPPPCNSGETCHVQPLPPPVYQPGTSATFSGPGNAGKREVERVALTRKQKLTRALALCRNRYKHSRRRRVACEREANRAYGAKRASAHGKRASAHAKRAGAHGTRARTHGRGGKR